MVTPSGRPSPAALSLAIQTDGKIVAAGRDSDGANSDALVARYNRNGSLDTSFGGTGIVRTALPGFKVTAFSVAIQSDGKIVVAGEASSGAGNSLFLARYESNGNLDTSFNGTGVVRITISAFGIDWVEALAIQPDGKIVAAGSSLTFPRFDFATVRFNANGTLDSTFNGTGIVATSLSDGDDHATSIAVQPDNKIVVAGSTDPTSSDFAVVRYNPNGTLDTSFNGTGKVVTPVGTASDVAKSMVLQADGKIVVAGNSATTTTNIGIVRYNANGSLDTSFNGTGKLISIIGVFSNGSDVALQADGKIVVAGESSDGSRVDVTVARYNDNGSFDTTFGNTGYVSTPIQDSSRAYTVALQADGKIVAAGSSTVAGMPPQNSLTVARYLAVPSTAAFDYDGDGRADISIFRPSNGEWYILKSQAGLYGVSFGAPGDKIAPADYDGDGKTDVAIYRPSNTVWYVLNSGNSTVSYYVFGIAEDVPTTADYDGDGKADLSVFRPSSGTWFRINSSNNSFFGYQFGQNGDKPALGDFDGDGKADISIYRPADGTWYRLNSGNGTLFGTQFGAAGDLHVPADYDGDAKTDISVFRPSNGVWYRLNSGNGAFVGQQFGANGDIPAPGDFEGDGKADVCVFRPSDGNWYRLNSSNNAFVAQPFGANGDLPTPAAFR